jgi:formylglycine-generating enzyme required for sulfatase activity
VAQRAHRALLPLPTEAEWEYAARAGTTTAYFWGDEAEPKIKEYAWYTRTPTSSIRKSEEKAESWGLYDILGNVSEWCLDQYDPHFYGKNARGKSVERRDAALPAHRARWLVG